MVLWSSWKILLHWLQNLRITKISGHFGIVHLNMLLLLRNLNYLLLLWRLIKFIVEIILLGVFGDELLLLIVGHYLTHF